MEGSEQSSVVNDESSSNKHPLPLFPMNKPFTALFAGHTMCGKTYLMKRYLRQFVSHREFEYIFILSTTLHLNGDYDEFPENTDKKNGRQLVSKYRRDIENHIKRIVSEQEQLVELDRDDAPDLLLVVEDSAGMRMLMYLGLIDKFCVKSRHFKISIFITTQKITAVGRTIRTNCRFFVLFHCSNFTELERFLTEMVSRQHRKQLEFMLDEIFREPFQFLLVDNFEPRHHMRIFVNGVDLLPLPTLRELDSQPKTKRRKTQTPKTDTVTDTNII